MPCINDHPIKYWYAESVQPEYAARFDIASQPVSDTPDFSISNIPNQDRFLHLLLSPRDHLEPLSFYCLLPIYNNSVSNSRGAISTRGRRRGRGVWCRLDLDVVDAPAMSSGKIYSFNCFSSTLDSVSTGCSAAIRPASDKTRRTSGVVGTSPNSSMAKKRISERSSDACGTPPMTCAQL